MMNVMYLTRNPQDAERLSRLVEIIQAEWDFSGEGELLATKANCRDEVRLSAYPIKAKITNYDGGEIQTVRRKEIAGDRKSQILEIKITVEKIANKVTRAPYGQHVIYSVSE